MNKCGTVGREGWKHYLYAVRVRFISVTDKFNHNTQLFFTSFLFAHFEFDSIPAGKSKETASRRTQPPHH
jgi:hypothetical protein